MSRKLSAWVVPAVLGAFALGAGTLASASANHGFGKVVTITAIEKSTAATEIDVDQSGGPSVGDVFVFQSDLFDPKTNEKIGTVEGHCMLITASGDVVDCDATGTFGGDQIRVGGTSSADATHLVFAVTGGTGAYRNVRGQITIENADDSTATDTLELIGVGH